MTRWANFFISDEQRDEVERRTRRMMEQWDFDNEKYHKEFGEWMWNVVVRDMIESGEISLASDTSGTEGKKLSEVAKEMKLRKFEFIDVFVDRTKHKKFTDPEGLQDYLADPTEAKFVTISDKVKGKFFLKTEDPHFFFYKKK